MEKINIVQIVNQEGCFDLQFRKDTKANRTNSPTYYRWKVQFIITKNASQSNVLESVRDTLQCGNVHVVKNQARYSVQNITEVYECVVPYFKKHALSGKKKNDFQAWSKAVEIIYKNKGKILAAWIPGDFQKLMAIHKDIAKYKSRPKKAKYLSMAETFAQSV
ncbi:MAG: LAGLIDADG family homing endonuclease [Candidatus Staskawiczbacteria bacterium]|jgi:hypothetical protein